MLYNYRVSHQYCPKILGQHWWDTLYIYYLPTTRQQKHLDKKSNERLFSILLCNLEIFFHKLFFLCFQHFTMQQVKYIHTNLVSVEKKRVLFIYLSAQSWIRLSTFWPRPSLSWSKGYLCSLLQSSGFFSYRVNAG